MTDKTESLKVEDFIDVEKLSDLYPVKVAFYEPVKELITDVVNKKYEFSEKTQKDDVIRSLFNDFVSKYTIKPHIVKWKNENLQTSKTFSWKNIRFYDDIADGGSLEIVIKLSKSDLQENTAMELASAIEAEFFSLLNG